MKGQIKGKYLQGSLPPVSQEYRDNYDNILWTTGEGWHGSGTARCMECGHWTPWTGEGPQYCKKHKPNKEA